MLEACFPFGPCVISKETFSPSFRVLKPLMLIAEKCANRSSLPSSGVMNPKPLESLNHLTVPVAIYFNPSSFKAACSRKWLTAGTPRLAYSPPLASSSAFAGKKTQPPTKLRQTSHPGQNVTYAYFHCHAIFFVMSTIFFILAHIRVGYATLHTATNVPAYACCRSSILQSK